VICSSTAWGVRPSDSPLRRHSGILPTPHVAGTTGRFMERTAAILETIR
jgi:phosphoglycerate dehydrogenase-like enzyme